MISLAFFFADFVGNSQMHIRKEPPPSLSVLPSGSSTSGPEGVVTERSLKQGNLGISNLRRGCPHLEITSSNIGW